MVDEVWNPEVESIIEDNPDYDAINKKRQEAELEQMNQKKAEKRKQTIFGFMVGVGSMALFIFVFSMCVIFFKKQSAPKADTNTQNVSVEQNTVDDSADRG